MGVNAKPETAARVVRPRISTPNWASNSSPKVPILCRHGGMFTSINTAILSFLGGIELALAEF